MVHNSIIRESAYLYTRSLVLDVLVGDGRVVDAALSVVTVVLQLVQPRLDVVTTPAQAVRPRKGPRRN